MSTWDPPTILLRCLHLAGGEYLLKFMANAQVSAKSAEVWRWYIFAIPGRCVQMREDIYVKTGVPTVLDVRLWHSPKKTISPVAYSVPMPFRACSFSDLTQKEENDWVDIVGVISIVDDSGLQFLLPKLELTLRSGCHHEKVELLGKQSSIAVRVKDTVAFHSVQVKQYKGTRKLTAGFCTVIIVNPVDQPNIPAVAEFEFESPSKKVMTAKGVIKMTSHAIKDALNTVRLAAEKGERPESITCLFHGYVKPKLFAEFRTAPYYGSDENPKIKYTATLADGHGEIPFATIWNDASRNILQHTGSEIVALWENCGELDGRCSFIDVVNENAGKAMEFTCDISVWKNNSGRFFSQFNVNRE